MGERERDREREEGEREKTYSLAVREEMDSNCK